MGALVGVEDGLGGDVPLIASKLSPPPAPRGYVERPRLSSLLDAAHDDAIRLTIVAAPPGYGKTLAVAGWLRSGGTPVAWITLEAADSDLARAAHYIAAALAPVRADAPRATGALFGPGSRPTPELAGATLLDAIARHDTPLVLVLDDYQVIASPGVHALVRFIVDHAPPFLHPVLISREDPPLPMARLRAHGRLLEIRADDLRYTEDEAARTLERDGQPLTGQLSRILALTEGWPAGLQLARLSLGRVADGTFDERSMASLGGSRFVLDYLADEVLDHLEPELREFLVGTSLADRFTAELCAEMTGNPRARGLLARAEHEQLFLVPLDQERRWYRYHQLFAECLRLRLDETQRRQVHSRAAGWLERNGLTEEAVAHRLAAGELEAAARLIELVARRLVLAGQHATLLNWLEALPDHVIDGNPELVSWLAWARFDTGQIGAADGLAARHLAGVEPEARGPAEGRLLIVRALLQTVIGPDAERFAREGLALIGDDPRFRSSALQAIGLAQLAQGRLAESVACLRDAFELSRDADPATAFSAITTLGQALSAVGRRDEAEQLCRDLAEAHPEAAQSAMGWYLDVVVGMLLLEANEIAEARRRLDRGFAAAARLRVGRALVEWAVASLAIARQADGDPAGALDALAAAARELRRSGLAVPVPTAETEARIRLAEGDIAGAERALDNAVAGHDASSPLAGLLRLSTSVTTARVRLAQRRDREAAAALREPETAYRRAGWVAELASVLVLKAAAAEGDGRRRDAIRALGEAVELAGPGGHVRRIVADGRSIAHLLPAVRGRGPAFVDRVLAAFGAADGASRAAPRVWSLGGETIEALTPREIDVLRLLADGARNDEVASSLGVSLGTARWHVGNVLAKLGERSRAKAVTRARALGIV